MRLPILTSQQMQRAEARAFEAGQSPLQYMEAVASALALQIQRFCPTPGPVHLLVGKGNNGGDALCAGTLLLNKGYRVIAHCLAPVNECSSLSKKMARHFEQAGGSLQPSIPEPVFESGIILDGIFGTGFTGKVEGAARRLIEAANLANLPTFAIDIPSGLNGTTGEVETVAIMAEATFSLGYPKLGYFIGQGWDHVGNLIHIDFGMPNTFLQKGETETFLLLDTAAAALLPPIKRSCHKYQAGYVLAVGGSVSMPGAPLLCCSAALRAGAGITRLFHPPGMRELLAASPLELIKEEWDLCDPARLIEESKRSKALLIGPGMGRDFSAHKALQQVLSALQLPTVIDADALYHLSQNPSIELPEQTVLTPHHAEMARLLKGPLTWDACRAYAKEKRVTIVLKGGPTAIFDHREAGVVIPRGDPGMASAGTGDVLTGIIAAQLARGLSPYQGACLAATLHGIAGEKAAKSKTSYGVIASDLIHYLPEAFKTLIQKLTVS